MIKVSDKVKPDATVLDKLKEWQNVVDGAGSFVNQSSKAKSLFKAKNIKSNGTFEEVKKKLTEICNSTRRCTYCEDSLADEVEHIYPKNVYPDKCFEWENYLYACGPCNGPKNDKFAVFPKGKKNYVVVNPKRGALPIKPINGEIAFINPRSENPLDYAILDLSATFKFVPRPGLSSRQKKKFEFTYNEVLRLNSGEREPLRQARKNAYENFKSRLFRYKVELNGANDVVKLNKMKMNLLGEAHITVFHEIVRQYVLGILDSFDSEFADIIDQIPDIKNW
jgi:uncharacterized protein (TIGR02646 family)